MKKTILFVFCALALASCGRKKDPVASHETCFPMTTRQENAAKFTDADKRASFLKACHVSDPQTGLMQQELSSPTQSY